ncbi:MAG: efflux RND transporter periplasmic adaptor subunit [Chlamydiota bacterium]
MVFRIGYIFVPLIVFASLQGEENYEGYLDFDVDKIYETDSEYQVIIDPKHRTILSAEVQSPVNEIYKKMGDSFKKGEVLIQLNDVVYQSNIKKAKAVLERAKVELEARKQLFQDNVASLFELKEAEANVAIAEAELAIATRDLESTKIEAPYDGKVVTLGIEEYELPQPGTELIEIVYDKLLTAKLLISTEKLKKLNIGQSFKIKIPEADKTITAKISRISSVIDPSSSTFKIEAEIDNRDQELWAGMKGEAEFEQFKKE